MIFRFFTKSISKMPKETYKFRICDAKGKFLGIMAFDSIEDLSCINTKIKEQYPTAYTKRLILEKDDNKWQNEK